MTDLPTLANSLTPKMREALKSALRRRNLDDRAVWEPVAAGATVSALYRSGLAERGQRLTYSNEPGCGVSRKAPLLTPLGLAVRDHLKEKNDG